MRALTEASQARLIELLRQCVTGADCQATVCSLVDGKVKRDGDALFGRVVEINALVRQALTMMGAGEKAGDPAPKQTRDALELEAEVSDVLLDFAGEFQEMTTSDAQGVAAVKARELVELISWAV